MNGRRWGISTALESESLRRGFLEERCVEEVLEERGIVIARWFGSVSFDAASSKLCFSACMSMNV